MHNLNKSKEAGDDSVLKQAAKHIQFLSRIISASITDANSIRTSAATISWMVLIIYTLWSFVDNILFPDLVVDSLIARLPIGVLAGISILLIRSKRVPLIVCEMLVLSQACLCMFQLFYFLWANDFHFVYGVGLLIVGTVAILALPRSSLCFLFIVVNISIYVFLATIHGWTAQDGFFLVAFFTTFGLGVMQTTVRIRLVNDLAEERIALRHQVQVSQAMATAMKISAHDLRSPLTAVGALIEHMPDEEHKELVKQAIQKINCLAGDLLKIGKHEYGNKGRSATGAITQNEVVETLKYLKALLNIQYQNRIVLIAKSLPKCIVKIDVVEFERIVMNLVVNALEASKEQVVVTFEVVGDLLELRISDLGVGIPESIEKQVFAGGYTSKGENGHGLGLLSVQRLLAECEGKLTYKRTNPGSCFNVSLPAVRT